MVTPFNESSTSPCEPSTLIELLSLRARCQPDKSAYLFLNGEESTAVSYGELDLQAKAICSSLQRLCVEGRPAGARALLVYPPGLEFIAAFFGCLYAGVIAVPAYPPKPTRNLKRLQAIAADADARVLLTTGRILSEANVIFTHAPELRYLHWLATDNPDPELAKQCDYEPTAGHAPAYLQYTSGSTATPKGVIVSHANALSNCDSITHGFGYDKNSGALTWLPHYHDMGLVSGVIQPLYCGFAGLLMSPASFQQQPFSWLEAISKYKVTHSGGPNFAYDLCLRRIGSEQRALLDLSGWRVAYNGAEPVREATLELFAETFAPCGFRRNSFYPAYGLAEATLKVSGRRIGGPPVYCRVQAQALEHNLVVESDEEGRHVRALVGSGRADPNTKIVIVDPEAMTLCPPNHIGEVWVSGPGVAQGYWNRPEETAYTFQAYLSDTNDGPFLRTGDLGFLKDGELFITGRLKDLIIIRGRNHYPQDIERAVEQCHAALRPVAGAAFSLDVDGHEQLIIVHETSRSHYSNIEEIIESIRQSVAEEHEIQPFAIVLVKPAGIPKTSSGKIQRRLCREKYIAGDFDEIARWRAQTTDVEATRKAPPQPMSKDREGITDWLRERISVKLKTAEIKLDQPISRYGLDSLAAMELTHLIETGTGVSLPFVGLLEGLSINRLADEILMASGADLSLSAPAYATDRLRSVPLLLSKGEESFWFLSRLAAESPICNVAIAVRIVSRLDVPSLRSAFQSLVERHVALRTVYPAVNGKPVRCVLDQAEVCFEEEDAATWSERELTERLEREAYAPFNLECGPLWRITLFRISATESVLLSAAHHIAVDLWSFAVLMSELRKLYTAVVDGREADLGTAPMQYADYASLQQEWLNSSECRDHREYWLGKLAGNIKPLGLPIDRPRPLIQTYNGASISFDLDDELAGELKALSVSHGATLYTTLSTAFQVLLHRYTGQKEIILGSPTSGRTHGEFAGSVGCFINPVVLYADLSGSPSFALFLNRARRAVLDALAHQDYPFAMLVEDLQLKRDPGRTPIFQVVFVWQKSQLLMDEGHEGLMAGILGKAGAPIHFGPLVLESMSVKQRVAQFDLTLTMGEVGGGITADLEYNTDLFDATSIERTIGHFRTLLQSIAADPAQRISELSLLTAIERQEVLQEWQGGDESRVSRPQELCLHEMFERQVEKTPDAVAVVFKDEAVSYAELNRRANLLAHRLQKLGVGPESLVGILMERSTGMAVGLMGILKAGGAYLPLDPSYPAERLSFMLTDADAALLLTEQPWVRIASSAPGSISRTTVEASTLEAMRTQRVSGENDENLRVNVFPDHPAYIIYTSGSTGRPKGVVVSHRSLVGHCASVAEHYRLGQNDRVLQFASPGFDVAAEELFPTWISGAVVVLFSDSAKASLAEFTKFLSDEELTVVNLPVTFWHRWIVEQVRPNAELSSALRLAIVGSEKVLVEQLSLWQSAAAGDRVDWLNAYGVTEATITSCIYRPSGSSPKGYTASVPIGRPIGGARVYILDQSLQPTPVGAPGELYIGGAGPARCYHNQATLTACKFIPDPFARDAGARLFRTGDYGRFLPDGNIEFLYRSDSQVKVRGFRVELGEIEAVLSQHPLVSGAAVTAREHTPGANRLTAYIVAQSQLTPRELRRYLMERLPEHMTPGAFVMLDELPSLPSGKIDKEALPGLAIVSTEADHGYIPPVAPQTEAEKILVEIWSRALGLERVGVTDNFFALGGDSILSLQIVAQADRAGLPLTPKQIFQYQTIAELAAVAGETSPSRAEQGSVSGPVPLTPIQCWFFEQKMVERHHYNQAVMLEAKCQLDADLLRQSFRHLLSHHDALRLRFTQTQSGWDQFNAPESGADEANDFFSLAAGSPERIASVQAGLNLDRGPLVRAALLRGADDQPDRLLIAIHHLAVDAVSWLILLEDLQTAYRQLSRREQVELPPKTTSFKRWAEALREYVERERQELEREAAYWLSTSRREVGRIPVEREGRESGRRRAQPGGLVE